MVHLRRGTERWPFDDREALVRERVCFYTVIDLAVLVYNSQVLGVPRGAALGPTRGSRSVQTVFKAYTSPQRNKSAIRDKIVLPETKQLLQIP